MKALEQSSSFRGSKVARLTSHAMKAATFCLLLVNPAAFAQSVDPQTDEQYFDTVRQELSLSEEQFDAVEPILAEGRQKQSDILASYGVDLTSTGEAPDLGRRQAMAMRAELKEVRKAMMTELEAVLTDEQLDTFAKMQQEQADKRRAEIRERMRSRF